MNAFTTKMFFLLKRLVAFLFIVIFPLYAAPLQDTTNLTNLFPNIAGNAKIDSLNNYVVNLNNSNPKLQLSIGRECFALSKVNNYKFGLAQSLNNIGDGFLNLKEKDSALVYFKKAYKYIDDSDFPDLEIKISINIADLYSIKYQFDSAHFYYKHALGGAVRQKDSVIIGNLFNDIGFDNWKKGGFNSAIRQYKAGLKIRRNMRDSNRIAKSLNNIGAAYYHLGDYKLSLDYYIEAQKIAKELSLRNYPLILNNIGLIYLSQKDYQYASTYFRNGLRVSIKIKSKLGIGFSYLNFGDLNFQMEEYEKALKDYNKALSIYDELGDINGVVKIINSIGQVYLNTNKLILAKKKFLLAYKKSKEHGLKLTLTESLINICKIQIKQGKNIRAKENLERAYEIAVSENFAHNKLKIFKLQNKVHENLNDLNGALLYLHNYNELKDSLFNEQSVRIVADAKEKYESKEKEKAYNHQIFINKIKDIELNRSKTENIYILLLSTLLLFAIIYLVYLNSQRKRKNIRLLKANEKIDEINLRLNKTNKLLKQSNSTKDKFFSIISHDLKNPFNTLLGASEILNLDDGGLSEKEKKELIEIISNDSKKLYSLLENLLFWANSQTGELKANRTNILLHQIVSEVIVLFNSSAKDKNITIEIDIPKSVLIVFDQFMFSTIIRNLLSNAIKFTNNGGKIIFRAIETNEKIELDVIDNGVGIEKQNLKKLFDERSNYRELGTNKEKGTGLGLVLCRDFAKENNSTISVTSKVGKGTTFRVVLDRAE